MDLDSILGYLLSVPALISLAMNVMMIMNSNGDDLGLGVLLLMKQPKIMC